MKDMALGMKGHMFQRARASLGQIRFGILLMECMIAYFPLVCS
jgi:hypothetical protein